MSCSMPVSAFSFETPRISVRESAVFSGILARATAARAHLRSINVNIETGHAKKNGPGVFFLVYES